MLVDVSSLKTPTACFWHEHTLHSSWMWIIDITFCQLIKSFLIFAKKCGIFSSWLWSSQPGTWNTYKWFYLLSCQMFHFFHAKSSDDNNVHWYKWMCADSMSRMSLYTITHTLSETYVFGVRLNDWRLSCRTIHATLAQFLSINLTWIKNTAYTSFTGTLIDGFRLISRLL